MELIRANRSPIPTFKYLDQILTILPFTNLIVNARFIRTGGTSAILEVTYFD